MTSNIFGNSSSVIVKKVCIGANRYQSARGKACYANCLDSYPDSDDNRGQFQVQFRLNYDDFASIAHDSPSFDNPVELTMEGQFVVFAGNQQFQPTRLISVIPLRGNNAKKPIPEQTK